MPTESKKTLVFLVCMTLLVHGCTAWKGVEDIIWPSNDGDSDGETLKDVADIVVEGAQGGADAGFGAIVDNGLSGSSPALAVVEAPAAGDVVTGTFVGGKIAQMRYDFNNLDGALARHEKAFTSTRAAMRQAQEGYYGLASGIKARLQEGTTPGNPILVRQWVEAQAQINAFSNNLWQLYLISNRAGADAGLIEYMTSNAKAIYDLPGGIDEDHVMLGQLEGDIEQTQVKAGRLLGDIRSYADRQGNFLAQQRDQMKILDLAIEKGRFVGDSLSSLTVSRVGVAGKKRLLMVIRISDKKVAYEDALYKSVRGALSDSPGTYFSVVAVTPGGDRSGVSARNMRDARRKAEEVLRALSGMGVPPERVELKATSDASVSGNEIRVYRH